MIRKAELLAPAGSFESLVAAVNAGADAVYIGGRKFGARAYAENAGEDCLIEGIRYAHLHGVKVHLTVNTLFKDSEMKELYGFLKPYYEAGLDAVIVQDLGVLDYLHRQFPLLSLHASTQMTVTGPESALLLKAEGVKRVIPARELSLSEIRKIAEETGLETEVFVHGALCYCYSGQCFMSSMIGGRSGNRGRCAQPCRLKYELLDTSGKNRLSRTKEPCLLSMRDLCSLDILPDILEAGVTSLKIEGRMKSPRYTAGTVSVWRKYLDLYYEKGRSGYSVEKEDRGKLLDLFDRGGQTTGYFTRHNGPDMMAMREKPDFKESNEDLFRYLDDTFVNAVKKIEIDGEAVFRKDSPMTLKVRCSGENGCTEAESTGPVPEKAEKLEAEESGIREKLLKTGNTVFSFRSLEIRLDRGLFVPVSSLKELRRDALSALENQMDAAFRRESCGQIPDADDEKTENREDAGEHTPSLHVTAWNAEQIHAAVQNEAVREISLMPDAVPASEWKQEAEEIRSGGKKPLLCLNTIFRQETKDYFLRHAGELTGAGFSGFVIRSLEEPGFLKRLYGGREIPDLYFDFNLYGMNREARSVLYRFGAKKLTLPMELNERELRETGCEGKELIVAGRLPMMTSAQCLKKNTAGCDHTPGICYLKDRTGKMMPVKNSCLFCCNTILNADPLSLVGVRKDVLALNPGSLRILLSTETKEEAERVISACAEAFLKGRDVPDPYPVCTRGHLKRGVE